MCIHVRVRIYFTRILPIREGEGGRERERGEGEGEGERERGREREGERISITGIKSNYNTDEKYYCTINDLKVCCRNFQAKSHYNTLAMCINKNLVVLSMELFSARNSNPSCYNSWEMKHCTMLIARKMRNCQPLDNLAQDWATAINYYITLTVVWVDGTISSHSCDSWS